MRQRKKREKKRRWKTKRRKKRKTAYRRRRKPSKIWKKRIGNKVKIFIHIPNAVTISQVKLTEVGKGVEKGLKGKEANGLECR